MQRCRKIISMIMALVISCLLITISISTVMHGNKKRHALNHPDYAARINTSYFNSLKETYCKDSFYVLEKDGSNLVFGLSQNKHGVTGTDDEYYLFSAATYNKSKDKDTFNQHINNILARTASINKQINLKNDFFQVMEKDVIEIHNRNNHDVNQAEAIPKEYSGIQIVKRAMIVIGTCFLLVIILYVKTRNNPINR